MSILPDNFNPPKKYSPYMKFEEGENKFRILSKLVNGWEEWINKKPIRYSTEEDHPEESSYFVAMIVWNYQTEKIEILQIKQVSIWRTITEFPNAAKHDINVMRAGEGQSTKYGVFKSKESPLSDHIKDAFYKKRCSLEAFMLCDDPFTPQNRSCNWTAPIFEQATDSKESVPSLCNPLEELREHLAIDGLNVDYLLDYVTDFSKHKNYSVEKTAEYLLTILDSFKDAYKKHLTTRFPAEQSA